VADVWGTPLAGEVALVTGAARGLGRAIARALAKTGARVALSDRDGALVRQAAAELAGAVALEADVGDPGQVRDTVAECVSRLGGLTVLVANAGIYPVTPFASLDESEWDAVIRTNLKGAYLCAKAAVDVMSRTGRGGSLIFTASTAAFHPRPGIAHYGASKAGIVALTRVLGLELGRQGIRVNAVCPGLIMTEGVRAEMATPEGRVANERVIRRLPLGRAGEPDDIAQAVVFLASPAARYVTGQLLVVDGGYSLGVGMDSD
jgi:NAD(P)-dependent dehydrogenase (short-subunit alcohol dehydrogenase family)